MKAPLLFGKSWPSPPSEKYLLGNELLQGRLLDQELSQPLALVLDAALAGAA